MMKYVKSFFDADVYLQRAMDVFIGLTKKRSEHPSYQWNSGERLKILFAGYAGARNTGGDVRVEEMIRQVRHILGASNCELSILTMDPKLTEGYFKHVHQVKMPQIFPPFLYQECPRHHGVIACEGSMFKSKFADALSTMMAGSLGMANAENKLSVGYGAEAGQMNPPLQKFVKRHCKKSLVICRNQASEKILQDFSIRTAPGTDTAWTFSPSSAKSSKDRLKEKGWDGKTKILALGPIHPFCWPVRPSIRKVIEKSLLGRHKKEHYKSVYFHEISAEDERKYQNYIQSIARAVKRFQEKHSVFPILVGMEKLDRKACEDLANELGSNPPLFISDEINMYDMVGILRQASMLLTSRFHAIVCSMPGLVPSAGITMDERIRNLMIERGHENLFLEVDEDQLDDKLFSILEKLEKDREKISKDISKTVPKQIKKMGEMGIAFENEVKRIYPDFPLPKRENKWENYLPTLDKNLRKLLENL